MSWIDEAEARCEAATPGPWRWGHYNPEEDPIELFRENLAHGKGLVWMVIAPEHPLGKGGWDERPAHAVVPAITGNGPDSEVNAVWLMHAREDLPRALAEIRRLEGRVDLLRRLSKNDIETVQRATHRTLVAEQKLDAVRRYALGVAGNDSTEPVNAFAYAVVTRVLVLLGETPDSDVLGGDDE